MSDWITGITIDENGIERSWCKLTDEAYERKFWFLKPPKEFLKQKYNIEISEELSKQLSNVLQKKWIDFVYTVEVFSIQPKLVVRACKLVCVAPIPFGKYSLQFFQGLIQLTQTFSDKETENIFLAMLADNQLTIQQAMEKFKKEDIDINVLKTDVDQLISDNPEQWEKARKQSNILNWFVGQIMKKYAGKIDATVVKSELETRLYDRKIGICI